MFQLEDTFAVWNWTPSIRLAGSLKLLLTPIFNQRQLYNYIHRPLPQKMHFTSPVCSICVLQGPARKTLMVCYGDTWWNIVFIFILNGWATDNATILTCPCGNQYPSPSSQGLGKMTYGELFGFLDIWIISAARSFRCVTAQNVIRMFSFADSKQRSWP